LKTLREVSLKIAQQRPHNNPWNYPPTISEFEEDVEQFRRKEWL
jgi:hypothetical protein